MANLDAANGLTPIGTMSGSPYIGYVRAVEVDAATSTAIFKGDLVTMNADGKVQPMAVAGIPYGVCVGAEEYTGVMVNGIRDNSISTGALNFQGHNTASTAGVILVAVGPDVLYEAQSDDATMVIADIGGNAEIIAGAGSTTTGRSAYEIDGSSVAVTATLPLRIVDFVQRPNNDIATANSRWVVRLNDTHFSAAVAGIN